MKKIFFLFLFIPFMEVSAQEKMLTLENTVFAARDGFTPQRLSQLNWITGTNEYYYIDKTSPAETLMRGKAGEKGTGKKVVDLNQLNDLILHSGKPGVSGLKTFPQISWTNATAFSFESETNKFSYSTTSAHLDVIQKDAFPADAENFDESPVTKYTAYTAGNNLYVRYEIVMPKVAQSDMAPIKGLKMLAVTTDKDINIVNGHSVHREEFGITKGTFWSPSGNLLAFYRMDQTMVTDYPVMDLTKQPAQAKMIKYPMAGGTSHQVTVGIYNVATEKTVFLKTGEPKDQYLTNIAWSPDNKSVYISVLNRDQNHLWLNRYNAETGAFEKTLFEETDPKYVHPMHPMLFVPGHPDQFIWQQELCLPGNPAGLNSLLLYNTDGKYLQTLTDLSILPGDISASQGETVTNVYGFDPSGTILYFQAAPIGTCDRYIYSTSVNPTKKMVKRLSASAGTHNIIFSSDKKYFIDTYSSIDVPGIQSIYDSNNKQVNVLLTATNPLMQLVPPSPLPQGYDPLKANAKGSERIKLFTITAADNETKLWCRMILPSNFDSTKKYRSLTYVYNGPNVQLITNTWMGGADYFLYYMAQQGFVVFTVDGRGSGNRGMKFEQATFQHLGTEEIADQEKGANYLKSLKYIDATRMAVYGWSYGGFMTTSLMTKKPDLYKCGVAGGPVIDWSYYEVMYTERYMDTPQSNPQGYKEANVLNYAGNLKGKLLQIHGTSDDVVVWQHSLLFVKACVDKGTQTDYYVYPGHLHNVLGKDRIHLNTKISEYIIANT